MDHVDTVLQQWARERPDLDVATMGVFGRLGRLNARTTDMYKAFWAEHGLGAGEFDVLATLRRAGTLTAGDLASSLMVTGGAITARIDRLVAKGLVERFEDPADRRSILISLSPDGLEKVNAMLPGHIRNQQQLLAPLSPEQQQHLADLLRMVLVSIESDNRAD